MMTDKLKNFFDNFGTIQDQKTYPKETPLESIVIDFAERWENSTKPGHGIFFDFKATPELEKPVLEYLTKGFGWTLEKPFFIRKPKNP